MLWKIPFESCTMFDHASNLPLEKKTSSQKIFHRIANREQKFFASFSRKHKNSSKKYFQNINVFFQRSVNSLKNLSSIGGAWKGNSTEAKRRATENSRMEKTLIWAVANAKQKSKSISSMLSYSLCKQWCCH